MTKIQFEKYKNRVNEVKKLLDEGLLYTKDSLVNKRNLDKLIKFRDFIKRNYFDVTIRHSDYYIKEINPLITDIKRIEKEKKTEIKDLIKNSPNPKFMLANLVRSRALWLIEEMTLNDETIKSLYTNIVKDIIEDNGDKKRVIAVDPDVNETAYDSAYKASQDLCIHPGSISKCCRKLENRVSATSKKDNKVYRFHYDGEELEAIYRKPRRINAGKIGLLLKKYNCE